MFEVLLDCTSVDGAPSILTALPHSADGDFALQMAHELLVVNVQDTEAHRRPVDARLMAKLLGVLPPLVKTT